MSVVLIIKCKSKEFTNVLEQIKSATVVAVTQKH